MSLPLLKQTGYHDYTVALLGKQASVNSPVTYTYSFANFFHPFTTELIGKLNTDSLAGMLDPAWQADLNHDFFDTVYQPTKDGTVQTESFPKEIDVSGHGSYAGYNWELFFHAPLAIAVALSKNNRFPEAHRFFKKHLLDSSAHGETTDPKKCWKFLAFRQDGGGMRIEDVVRLVSTPAAELSPSEQSAQKDAVDGYTMVLNKPFQPHAVARTRILEYQYHVVMKYLDNLIAWGDQLFLQDTLETIDEATQIYVMAANFLGIKPEKVPSPGKAKPKSFAQLRAAGLGPFGDALVDLEAQFPLNLVPSSAIPDQDAESSALFGIGRTLYFCIPPNAKLLGYWDTVADRLFKIRHCMNIEGVVRPLSLFDPPIDPGMLVKAAAAGLDLGSVVSGLNQPVGPVRSTVLIQKALELCGEVRALGSALLAALEKGDGEHMALVRQRHEIQIQQLTQDVRFLQWKQAEEATASLLTTRDSILERLRFHQRLLGLPADPNAPDTVALTRTELTEDNFDDVHSALVDQYGKLLTLQQFAKLKIVGDTSPATQSGASSQGRTFLNVNENAELNTHLPTAAGLGLASAQLNTLASSFTPIPDANGDLHYWGMGTTVKLPIGTALQLGARIAGEILGINAAWERDQAGMASRTASYERRADDWTLNYNSAAHDMMQNGRQIISALMTEQSARREYYNARRQVANAQEIDQVLNDKFTKEDLYIWSSGETSRLYYEFYRFAFDTARRAEKTMKQELMRPEIDSQDFVKFNYWDGGRKGLLSGEALYLDVKRLEMAYHDSNKRELELTKHVSLRQLDPIALLTLRSTGSCQVTIPEWLYDLDCPGHYMRRIKSVSLTIPSVVGPYTSVNCTLSLLRSTVRKSPVGDYLRQGPEDDRFVDYVGAVQSIVTSGAQNDGGMFEINLRDEKFLPFEGAGAASTWKLDLPVDYPIFDHATISDVVLHIRFTARQGVPSGQVSKALQELFAAPSPSSLALLISLRHDFPTEWSSFVKGADPPFKATVRRDFFPYFAQGKTIAITGMEIYGEQVSDHRQILTQNDWDTASNDLKNKGTFQLEIPPDAGQSPILSSSAQGDFFMIVRYSLN